MQATIDDVSQFQARRKSRGDQKRDLALLESQSNAWREQISEKTTEIQEKDQRIQVRSHIGSTFLECKQRFSLSLSLCLSLLFTV